ncbi:hypothetical protein GCM10028856_35210 [Halopiger thermotolerans]
MSESASNSTTRFELRDIETTSDGGVFPVMRVRYRRPADEPGVCPFCESDDDIEFVDEIGPGGQWRKRRYECGCGAYGDSIWTWPAGYTECDHDG